jgi:crotonobetainyl-CoA:carnitine CoA-transferase CaiB-like acyl-CoA transferase
MKKQSPAAAPCAGTLLTGLRVVELSRSAAAAYCGLVFAQLGADVLRAGPPTQVIASRDALPLVRAALHRGKRAAGTGAELVQELAAADVVVVEPFDGGEPLCSLTRTLIAHRAGLRDAAVLLVLGQAGAADDEARPGCSLTSAAAAAMSCAIGNMGAEPLAPPYDIAAYQVGIHGVGAALAALQGGLAGADAVVEVAARDVLASLVGTLAQNYLPFGRPWRREGTRPSLSGGVYPCGLFPCKDGYVAIYCRGTAEWQAIFDAMERPGWTREERFRDPKVVATLHADEADAHLLPWLARFTRAELMALGLKFGFPASPVRYVREALADEQFAWRGSLQALPGGVRVPAPPWRVVDGPVPVAAQRAAQRDAQPARLLEGLRVLDFSWVWSGPMVTSLLADLGAEVLKVEHPSRLDSLRQRARPIRDGVEMQGPVGELNPWFNQLNHGKKSIVVDMKSAAGQAQLLRLAQSCDIVVENMRPGAMSGSGLGYEDLARVNPGLVMLSMSMAGQTGPLARMKGYAGIMTSMAGLESVVGYPSALPDAPFTGMTMTALGDPNGAGHAVAVLMAALLRRRRTGQGAWIDLAQTDAILAILTAPVVEAQVHGHVPVIGNEHPEWFPHGHFPARGSDRWIAIAVRSDAEWRRFVSVVAGALAPLAGCTLAERRVHRTTIMSDISAWTAVHGTDEIEAVLGAAGIACASVASYEEMLDAPWLERRGLTRRVSHYYLGDQDVFVAPWLFGGRTAGTERPAPLLGQHTEEVLGPTVLERSA